MSVSLPSKPALLADVPEPVLLSADFVYDFFVPDESVSEGEIPPAVGPTSNEIERTRRGPRHVRVRFNPAPQFSDPQEQIAKPPGFLLGNANKIVSERELSAGALVGINLQDTAADGKLFQILSGSLKVAIIEAAKAPPKKASFGEVFANLTPNELSLNSAALLLQTSLGVDETLASAIADQEQTGIEFLGGISAASAIDRIMSVNVPCLLASTVMNDVLSAAADNPLTLLSDELLQLLPRASAVQKAAQAAEKVSDTLDLSEFEVSAPFVSVHAVNQQEHRDKRQIVGYVLDKSEVLDDGTLVQHASLIAQGPDASEFADPRVRYGATYVYTVRTVASISFEAVSEDPNDQSIYLAEVLVSSRPSSHAVVQCVEHVPPPSPADISIAWDWKAMCPRLSWSFPYNSQRDIKRFQVFRRTSLSEPFKLLVEIDFDDSLARMDSGETPGRVLKVSEPQTGWLDSEIRGNLDHIYALACVDAHGMTSSYSEQLWARWNRHGRKIEISQISRPGAPRAFPNMFVEQDIMPDALQLKNWSTVHVHFDPTMIELKTTKQENQQTTTTIAPIVETDKRGGKYVLQLLNTDLGRLQQVEIVVEDQRS